MPERDEGGLDFTHALAVAGRVDGLDAKVVALLHDSIEDGAVRGSRDILDAGFSDEIIEAVETLTRNRDEAYVEYIERIKESGNDLAVYVKLADLDANLARMDAEHASLIGRYKNAEQILRGIA